MMGFLSRSDEGYALLLWMKVLAVANSSPDSVCYCLQDLVVAPAVALLTQGFRIAAENVLKAGSLSLSTINRLVIPNSFGRKPGSGTGGALPSTAQSKRVRSTACSHLVKAP